MSDPASSLAAAPRGPAEDQLIVCESVVRIYQHGPVEVQALQGLDLHVTKGEMIAVVGPSGAGNSTLLSILAGADAPAAGTVRVAGWDLAKLPATQRVGYRRSVVGLVQQQASRNLIPSGFDTANLIWGDERVAVRGVADAGTLPVRLGFDDDPTVVVDRQVLSAALSREIPASRAWAVGPDAAGRLATALDGLDSQIVTRAGWMDAQSSAPLPKALDALFVGATAVAAVLAVLAVILLAASGAGERTRVSAQLRVLGTSRRQAARVAWWVLALPLVVGLVARVSVQLAGLRGRRQALGPLMRAS